MDQFAGDVLESNNTGRTWRSWLAIAGPTGQIAGFQGWLQGHCGAFWDALFGHEHLEQRQEALVEGVLVVDPKDPPPPPLPHRDYPCRSGRRPNRRLEL